MRGSVESNKGAVVPVMGVAQWKRIIIVKMWEQRRWTVVGGGYKDVSAWVRIRT